MKYQELVPDCLEKATGDTIMACVGDGVSVHGQDYRILYQNQAMQELFGPCMGQICYEAYRQETAVCPGCPVAACFATGEVQTAERIIAIGGIDYVFETSASPIRDRTGTIVAVVEVVRNATQRKQAEAMILRLSNLFKALSYTNKAMLYINNRDELFREICRVAVEYGKFSLAVIGILDPRTRLLRPVAHSGSAEGYINSLIVSDDQSRDDGRGPTGIAIRGGQPYICNDFANDPSTTPWRTAALEHGIRSSAAFPLEHEGRFIGALKVYAEQKDFFDQQIIELLQEMTANISFALTNYSREEQRQQAEEALRQSEERLQLVLEGSNDGFWDWNTVTGEVSLSDRFHRMMGYNPGEIEANFSAIARLIHPEDWPRVNNVLHHNPEGPRSSYEIEYRMLHKDQKWEWILFRGKVVATDSDENPLRVAGTCSNITERKLYDEKLRYASSHDPLTGLFNRTYFDVELERLTMSRQYPVSFVIADVDGLKLVNDRFGHGEGDNLIKRAATVLRDTFRGEDLVARVGGDEFAVILPDTDADAVKEAIKRVLACQSTMNEERGAHPLTISMGAATADTPEQLAEALKMADSRMYFYKFRRKSQQRKAMAEGPDSPPPPPVTAES